MEQPIDERSNLDGVLRENARLRFEAEIREESTRQMAEQLASIVIPFSSGNITACLDAVDQVLSSHFVIVTKQIQAH